MTIIDASARLDHKAKLAHNKAIWEQEGGTTTGYMCAHDTCMTWIQDGCHCEKHSQETEDGD